jgi:hypothetical protein
MPLKAVGLALHKAAKAVHGLGFFGETRGVTVNQFKEGTTMHPPRRAGDPGGGKRRAFFGIASGTMKASDFRTMLLCHRHNFLYVHIAKTGGTSVRRALVPYRRGHPYAVLQFLCSRMSGFTGHKLGCKFPRHARVVAAEQMLPREFFDGLFKFAFVRNPWDLQVSSYHHLKRERPHLVQEHPEFADFLCWKLNPDRDYQYHLDTSIEIQSDYLKGADGGIVVDFVGRYERLQEDFNHVCETVGIKPFDLPHRRKATDRSKYRDYYDEETRQLVAARFAEDIERFEYTF